MVKIGQLVAGRYELEELLGVGGMSSVFRARDALLERWVALKILHDHHGDDAESVARFRREAEAIARLSHPNVVTVIDRGEWEGRQYIVFEHVAGENLKQLVQREGRLPVARALELAVQAARGLAYAHERGIVHRDVKPHNVLLDGEETAKVTDFGIARSLDPEHGLTQTGTVLGTSDYIAPEQVQGGPVDARSDQYALGALLYELLVGQPPYRGDGFMAVAMSHVQAPVPDVRRRRRDVPADVAAIVARAMAKAPEERFPTMQALVAALEAALAGKVVNADGSTQTLPRPALPRRASPRRPGRGRRPGRRTFALLAALLVLVGAVLAGVLLAGGAGDLVPGAQPEGPSAATAGENVPLRALADYDPLGDGREHPEDVPDATDGNPSTYWTTETYHGVSKAGVGIVLDAGEPRALASVAVTTDTPGFTAVIQAGAGPDGPFEDVSPRRQVTGRTTFRVDMGGEEYQYYVVWITDPNGRAHVNEVTGRASERA